MSGATPPVSHMSSWHVEGLYFTFTSTFMTHKWDEFGDKRATTRVSMLTDKLRQQRQQRIGNFCITHGYF